MQASLTTAARHVHEPHMGIDRNYKGVSANELFSKVYGPSWTDEDEVLFTCSDGYQPSVPVTEFKTFDAYFVYGMQDGSEFMIDNNLQNQKNIELGPYYLVWDNIKHPELRSEPPSFWPYQVVSVDLISFAQRFPKLAPAADSEAIVKTGFSWYRKYCMSCHAIGGEGGEKGPDLEDISRRYSPKWLSEFITNPRSLRPESTMARLNPDLKERDRIIDSIVRYLETQ